MNSVEQYLIRHDDELADVFFFRAQDTSILHHQGVYGLIRGRVSNQSDLSVAQTFTLPNEITSVDVLQHIAQEKLRTRKFPAFVKEAV